MDQKVASSECAIRMVPPTHVPTTLCLLWMTIMTVCLSLPEPQVRVSIEGFLAAGATSFVSIWPSSSAISWQLHSPAIMGSVSLLTADVNESTGKWHLDVSMFPPSLSVMMNQACRWSSQVGGDSPYTWTRHVWFRIRNTKPLTGRMLLGDTCRYLEAIFSSLLGMQWSNTSLS